MPGKAWARGGPTAKRGIEGLRNRRRQKRQDPPVPESPDHGPTAAPAPAEARPRPRRLRRLLWLWGPAVVYIAAVFTVSSIPLRNVPVVWKSQDKAAHFAEYAVLAALLFRALAPGRGVPAAAAVALLASFLLAGLDELHQVLVPGRSADWRDAAADAIGALLGTGLAAVVAAAWRRSKGREETRTEPRA
jgi:VanZ family protein